MLIFGFIIELIKSLLVKGALKMYTAIFKAKEEEGREFDISYRIIEEDKGYYIECSIDGGATKTVASIGNCGNETAERLGNLFAREALRPCHLEDVISDMRF